MYIITDNKGHSYTTNTFASANYLTGFLSDYNINYTDNLGVLRLLYINFNNRHKLNVYYASGAIDDKELFNKMITGIAGPADLSYIIEYRDGQKKTKYSINAVQEELTHRSAISNITVYDDNDLIAKIVDIGSFAVLEIYKFLLLEDMKIIVYIFDYIKSM